jgi:hypothetical protein
MHPWPSDAFPYEVLEATGIDALSSHDQVLDGALLLQQQDRFGPEMRSSWDLLRTAEQRLATDFFLIRAELSRPHEFLAAALAQYSTEPDSVVKNTKATP